MISNHVTFFILFYWSDIVFFFFCVSSFSLKLSLASQNAFLLVWILHQSSSWSMLVYILFYFIYGGGVVCFLGCWEISAPSPSLSIPSLAVPELPFQWRASILSHPCPAFSGLTRACLDVLPCAPCSAAQYFSGFNCFVAGSWKQAEGVAAI